MHHHERQDGKWLMGVTADTGFETNLMKWVSAGSEMCAPSGSPRNRWRNSRLIASTERWYYLSYSCQYWEVILLQAIVASTERWYYLSYSCKYWGGITSAIVASTERWYYLSYSCKYWGGITSAIVASTERWYYLSYSCQYWEVILPQL
jgi:hypothetical protein